MQAWVVGVNTTLASHMDRALVVVMDHYSSYVLHLTTAPLPRAGGLDTMEIAEQCLQEALVEAEHTLPSTSCLPTLPAASYGANTKDVDGFFTWMARGSATGTVKRHELSPERIRCTRSSWNVRAAAPAASGAGTPTYRFFEPLDHLRRPARAIATARKAEAIAAARGTPVLRPRPVSWEGRSATPSASGAPWAAARGSAASAPQSAGPHALASVPWAACGRGGAALPHGSSSSSSSAAGAPWPVSAAIGETTAPRGADARSAPIAAPPSSPFRIVSANAGAGGAFACVPHRAARAARGVHPAPCGIGGDDDDDDDVE